MYFPESFSQKKLLDLGFSVKEVRGLSSFFQFEKREGIRLTQAKGRLIATSAFFILFFLSIVVRLIEIMAVEGEETLSFSQNIIRPITFSRADIVDRHGVLLATNLKTASLYAHPHQILDIEEAVFKLSSILSNLTVEEIKLKLTSSKKFVWLARNLTPEEQAKVHNLGIPGLNFHFEEKRVYPHGALLGHIIGFTDVDNHGIGGVEHSFDQQLRQSGDSLRLSIDMRIQHILTDEIQKGIELFNAQGGTGIILDIRTGEILAITSLPDFDPNMPHQSSPDSLFNKATLGIYEMGSVFKLFTAAMALDKGTTSLSKGYDASHPMKVGRFIISDEHPKNRWLSVPEIIIHSSNIGTSKMALDVGAAGQKEFFEKLGFLKPISLEISETGRPLVPKEWKDITVMTISYGYGLGISPLHLVSGIAGFVNKGILPTPTLLAKNDRRPGRRVISEATSQQIRKLMRLVVTDGTGRKAAVEGYVVGGKTGSAILRKAGGKGYTKGENHAFFVAAFPMYDPKYVILVMLEKPKGNKDTFGFTSGGWIAAPVVRHIIERIAPILDIFPVDEKDPHIYKLLEIPEFVKAKESKSSVKGVIRHARY